MRLPVRISNTFKDLSREVERSHLLSGCEKHKSVILLEAAFGNDLTVLRPLLTFRI